MTKAELITTLENVPDDYEVLMGSKHDWKKINFAVSYHFSGVVIFQDYFDRGSDKNLDMTEVERKKSFQQIVSRAADWYLWKD